MYCNQCGKEIPDGVRFCSFCGCSQLPPPAPKKPVCPVCGRELNEQAAFCCHCGAKVNSQPDAKPGQDVSPQGVPYQGQIASAQGAPYQGQGASAAGIPYQTQSNPYQAWETGTQKGQFGGKLKDEKIMFTHYGSDRKLLQDGVKARLYLYQDRLELDAEFVNDVFTGTPLGLLTGKIKAKTQPPVVIPMDQIASIRDQRSSFAFLMKNREEYLLSPIKKPVQECERTVQECIQIIRANIR